VGCLFASLRCRSSRFDDERLNQKVKIATLKKLECINDTNSETCPPRVYAISVLLIIYFYLLYLLFIFIIFPKKILVYEYYHFLFLFRPIFFFYFFLITKVSIHPTVYLK